jgi:hypothetical protein
MIYRIKTAIGYLGECMVIGKDVNHAIDQAKTAPLEQFENVTETRTVIHVHRLTEEEIKMDDTHVIKLRPTQKQMFYEAQRKIGEADQIFLEMIEGDHPITKKELRHLIETKPETWSRYKAYLDSDQLKEE